MIPNKLRIPAWFFMAAAAVCWIPTGPAAAASAPQVQTPSAPLNLTATASGSIVDLAWQAPTSGSPITRYEVEVSANAGVSWSFLASVAASETTYTHRGLQTGATLRYRVRARNARGLGMPAVVDVTTGGARTPRAPLNLTATTIGSIVDLAWDAPSWDGGRSITHYEIHVSVNGGAWIFGTNTAVRVYRDETASAGAVRRYRVRAWNAIGPGFWTNTVVATTGGAGTPTAPLNLTATTIGSIVDLAWDAPSWDGGRSITHYEIHVSVNGGAWSFGTNTAVRVYRDATASAGAVRRYRVRAVNAFGPGAPAYVDATAAGPPGPPRNLEAVADGSSVIELNWDAPLENGGSAITGYRIEESADGRARWSTRVGNTRSTATDYRHTGLSGGTTFHYRVSAINANGTGDPSNVDRATTELRAPGAPRRLSATARGTSRIALGWTAPLYNGGSPVTGYRIEVSRTRSGSWVALETDTESTTTAYTHTGLSPGSTRYYRVSAINRVDRGAWSSVVSATTDVTVPGAPTGLRAVRAVLGGSDRLLLTWTRPSTDGGSAIKGYLIQMSLNGVSRWTEVVANTRSATTTYLHTGLAPGTTRYYRVAAINAQGPGTFSTPPVKGTTDAAPPGQPLRLRAHAGGPTSITLTWERPASTGGAPITGYSVRARSPNDGTWITIQRNTESTATTFTHTGLQPATAYRYQVAAINSEGPGPWSLEASTSTHPDVPAAPFNLTARAVGTSQIDLSWSAPRNTGGAPILGYRIEASSDGGTTWRIIRRNTNSTSTRYSDQGLQPATTRHYRVAATNTAGTGPASTVRHATTEATLPGAPRDLTAEADGTSEIDLSWQAPTADGGAQVSGYRIEVSENSGGTWRNLVANTRSTRTTYSHTSLEPATTRHYRVSAINRIGVGRASSIASATTDATVPDAPTGLVATATTPTQIDLAWVAPDYDGGAPITGHRIEVSETGAVWTDLQPNTGIASPTFSHPGLLPGSTRFYRVSAINRAGAGAPSGVASAATDDPVERAGRLNTRVLPHVAAAMTSSTVSAIARRVDAVANGMGMERRMETGLSSMAASLSSPGGVGLGRQDRSGLSSLFGGASFQMPLGATDAPQETSTGTQMGSWGAGEYHYLGEPGSSVLDWSGNMVSAHVGVDGRLAPDMLAGLAASYSSGSFDFTDKTGASPVTGTYATTMTSVNPYVAWFSGDRGNAVWATAGYGWGDIEVDDQREGLRTSPARTMTGGAGGSYQLLESGIGGVRVKAEGWAGQVMVDGGERVDSVTLAMQRGKLALEWTQGFRSTAGHEVAIMLEGGMRYDNGDGVNGTSGEVGGGLRYTNADVGVTAEGRGRLLVSAREGYEEWGLGGMILFDPATRGQGLQVRLAPSYGDAASGVNQLWERGVSGAVRDHDMGRAANLDGEVAYGVAGFQGTPYSGFYLAENGVRAFSSGVRYDLGAGLGLRLEGTRRESGFGAAEHSVGIRGRVRFR